MLSWFLLCTKSNPTQSASILTPIPPKNEKKKLLGTEKNIVMSQRFLTRY